MFGAGPWQTFGVTEDTVQIAVTQGVLGVALALAHLLVFLAPDLGYFFCPYFEA